MSMQVVRISEPNPKLAAELRELFAAEQLEGSSPGFSAMFALFDSNGSVEGAASVEAAGEACVLRAVVVRPGSRKKGLGYALISHILFQSSGAHEKMYLVARGEQGYFERFGFRVIPRSEVPEAVVRSISPPGRDPAEGPVMVIDLPTSRGAP